MLAFEVSINGVKRCITGIEADGCMMAMLTWLQRDPSIDRYNNELDFDVSASLSREDIHENGKWLKETLTVGDSITIHIVEATEVDALTTQRSTPRDRERSERRYYEQLKQKYRRVNRRRKKTA